MNNTDILTIVEQFQTLTSDELVSWLVEHMIRAETAWRVLYLLGLPNEGLTALLQLYKHPWCPEDQFHHQLHAIIKGGAGEEQILWFLENCMPEEYSNGLDYYRYLAQRFLKRHARYVSGERVDKTEEDVLIQYWKNRIEQAQYPDNDTYCSAIGSNRGRLADLLLPYVTDSYLDMDLDIVRNIRGASILDHLYRNYPDYVPGLVTMQRVTDADHLSLPVLLRTGEERRRAAGLPTSVEDPTLLLMRDIPSVPNHPIVELWRSLQDGVDGLALPVEQNVLEPWYTNSMIKIPPLPKTDRSDLNRSDISRDDTHVSSQFSATPSFSHYPPERRSQLYL